MVTIRRPGRYVADGPRRWAVVDCRVDREAVIWGTFDDDHELLTLDAPALLNRPVDGSSTTPQAEYLVCAHGTHDACCAIRGRPLAAALEAHRPGRVWECSHVGGDRFAANLLVLPSGLLYGGVRPEQALDLVELTERGAVDPAALRGRVGFGSAEQAAMKLAHERFPQAGWRDVRVAAVDRDDPHRIVVTVTVAGAELMVVVRVSKAEPRWLTCQSASPGAAVRYEPTLLTT